MSESNSTKQSTESLPPLIHSQHSPRSSEEASNTAASADPSIINAQSEAAVMLAEASSVMGDSFVSTMDNSLASTKNTSSRNYNSSRARKKQQTTAAVKSRKSAEQQLEEINAQLAAIRREKEESSFKRSGRVLGKRVDYSKPPKKSFHHPNLDYVMGELIYSPYRTHPLSSYTDETFRMSEKLKSLKREGRRFEDIPDEQKPYDLKQVKRSFVKEIANYNPGFNIKARNIEILPPGQRRVRSLYVLGDCASVASSHFVAASTADSTTASGDVVSVATTGVAMGAGAASINSSISFSSSNEPKSLQRHMAEFRGGPQKFKEKLPQELRSKRMHASARSLDGALQQQQQMTGSDAARALQRFQNEFPLLLLLAQPSTAPPRETSLSPLECRRHNSSNSSCGGSVHSSLRARTTSPLQSEKLPQRRQSSASVTSSRKHRAHTAATATAAATTVEAESCGVEFGEPVLASDAAADEYNDDFEADQLPDAATTATTAAEFSSDKNQRNRNSSSKCDAITPSKPTGSPSKRNTPCSSSSNSGKTLQLKSTPTAPPPTRAPPAAALADVAAAATTTKIASGYAVLAAGLATKDPIAADVTATTVVPMTSAAFASAESKSSVPQQQQKQQSQQQQQDSSVEYNSEDDQYAVADDEFEAADVVAATAVEDSMEQIEMDSSLLQQQQKQRSAAHSNNYVQSPAKNAQNNNSSSSSSSDVAAEEFVGEVEEEDGI